MKGFAQNSSFCNVTKVQPCAQKTRRDALIIRYKLVGHDVPQGVGTECLFWF